MLKHLRSFYYIKKNNYGLAHVWTLYAKEKSHFSTFLIREINDKVNWQYEAMKKSIFLN